MSTPVVVWSQTLVSYVDSNGVRHSATTLAELASKAEIRSAIVLVAHRNSLIRLTKVPNLKPAQLEPLIRAKTNTLIPTGTQGYGFGYRLAADASGEGKLAILGGAKFETLRRIYTEAQSCGIKVLAVLPSAFASWIAATEKGIRNGVVLSGEGSDTCFDVISEGELVYSRFTRITESDDLSQEIEATFQTAGLPEGPILALGHPFPDDRISISSGQSDPREPSDFVRDLGQIQRSLFSLELPEEGERRDKRKLVSAATRGVLLSVAAAAAWAFVVLKHRHDDLQVQNAIKIDRAMDEGEREKIGSAEREANELRQSEHLLNIAFDPAQTFGDIVATLAKDSSDRIWLTGLSVERGGTVSIRGQARDQKTISTYAKTLRSEPRFRDVQLKFSTQGLWNNEPTYQFVIVAWPVGNLPFDRYMEPISK